LDILDVEGAGLVYQRLVDLCQGCHEDAQSLLDSIESKDLKKEDYCDMTMELPLLESSPFTFELSDDGPVSLMEFCLEIRDFHRLVASAKPELPSDALMDQARDKLMTMVSHLSLRQCIFLLRNWLLSLAVCDVSIFVTVQKLNNKLNSREISNLGLLFRDKTTVTYRNVTKEFVYSLHLIDCDQKPSKKLKGRSEKEEIAFRLLASSEREGK
jgi:inositol-pentakisphosphate 2-kinase